jgi:hypothetical protein
MNVAVPAIDYMTRPHIVGHYDAEDNPLADSAKDGDQ